MVRRGVYCIQYFSLKSCIGGERWKKEGKKESQVTHGGGNGGKGGLIRNGGNAFSCE